jgi:hypothetical protein
MQRRGHPACGTDALGRPIGATSVKEWLAVGDHDEFPPFQPEFYQIAEFFEIPSVFHKMRVRFP